MAKHHKTATDIPLPEGLRIGALLSAHEVEGADYGTDWWHWEQRPGHILDTTTSDPAADHWNRYQEDCALARKLGMQVVFAPSDVVDFYKDTPQRKAVLALPKHELPERKHFNPPPPAWSGTGGCECAPNRPCRFFGAWNRQHPDLRIEDDDLIIDCNKTEELYNLCAERGITTLLYMGVASNMCIINRAAGIKQMTQLHRRCILVRDLSAAISGNGFDPDKNRPDPSLTPESGTRQVLHHLEQYWCPSMDSKDLLKAAKKKSN